MSIFVCFRVAKIQGRQYFREYMMFFFLDACPAGWIEFNNDCYFFAKHGPGINWNQAQDYCISSGGKLADILDQETQDFVKHTGDSNIYWWLGGHKTSHVSGT